MLSNSFTISYAVYNSSSRDFSFTYDVSTVENDITFTYNVLATTTRSFGIRYDINVGKNLILSYDINQRKNLSIKYDINVWNSLTFSWGVFHSNDYTFAYSIEQYSSQSQTTEGIRDGAIVTSRNNLVSVYTQDIYIMKQIRPLNVANWEDPVVVTKGSHPSLTDQLGTLWLVWEYNNYVYMSSSLDGGRTFSNPITLKT